MRLSSKDLEQIEKRILQVDETLSDEDWKSKTGGEAVPLAVYEARIEKASRPLRDERAILERKRGYIVEERQYRANIRTIWTSLVVGLLTVIVSLTIAFAAPPWEKRMAKQALVQSVYQAIVANNDIFVDNYNGLKLASSTTTPMSLPLPPADVPLTEEIRVMLQRELGIVQYRFFLHYVQETQLLSEQVDVVRNELSAQGSLNGNASPNTLSLLAMMDALQTEGWFESRFNYLHDSECLVYMMRKAFSFVRTASREKNFSCSTDSYNRIYFHYGYIPSETPEWMIPEMRRALNQRAPGLGDELVF